MVKSIIDQVVACHGDCRKCPPTCPILDGKEPPTEAMRGSVFVSVQGDEEFADCPPQECRECQRDVQNCPLLGME